MTDKITSTQDAPTNTATAASIAELWRRWARLAARYDAAADKNSRAARYDYGSAKILALCLASIRARTVDETRPKVEVVAWYRLQNDDSHIEIAIEACLTADMEALQPPLTRELH